MKKTSKKSIYLIINLIYIIPGIFCAFLFLNSYYVIFSVSDIISIPDDLPQTLGNILGIIIIVPFLLFYFMSLNFTILIHPAIQIIIFLLVRKNKDFSKKDIIIIIFILSIMIAFVYLYLIWVKRHILTA